MDITEILYGGKTFSGISPAPFVYFDTENINYGGTDWGKKYKVKLDGQITGKCRDGTFYELEKKKQKLILNFKDDHKNLEIFENGSSLFCEVCQVESISFEESRYVGILPFSVSLSCYNSGSFGGHYGVINPVDSWDFSESEDSILTIKHDISANSAGSSDISAAKKWAQGRTGIAQKIKSLKFDNFSGSFMLDSFSEQINRFDGKYSIQETYRGDLSESGSNAAGILRYTFDSNTNIEDGLTSLSIEGSIAGKMTTGIGDMLGLRGRFNGIDFLDLAQVYHSNGGGTAIFNDMPLSRKVSENINNSELTFSMTYDNHPMPSGRCEYTVELSENLIKNIIDVNLNAEILCSRGDQSVRWGVVTDYYNKFDGYSLAVEAYAAEGYSKGFYKIPRTESITFDEFNSKINYKASWTDKYLPYPDILISISETVEITPSINIHAVQPSLYAKGNHNVQSFQCASRTSVSIQVSAASRPDKTSTEAMGCVEAELERLKSIYVGGPNLYIDNMSRTVNEETRHVSIAASYSFDGQIIS